MKTSVKFGTSYEQMRNAVTVTLVTLVSERNINSVDLPAAITAVTEAFDRADGNAGNGGSPWATATQGVWMAKANIDTSEFYLWRQVI